MEKREQRTELEKEPHCFRYIKFCNMTGKDYLQSFWDYIKYLKTVNIAESTKRTGAYIVRIKLIELVNRSDFLSKNKAQIICDLENFNPNNEFQVDYKRKKRILFDDELTIRIRIREYFEAAQTEKEKRFRAAMWEIIDRCLNSSERVVAIINDVRKTYDYKSDRCYFSRRMHDLSEKWLGYPATFKQLSRY